MAGRLGPLEVDGPRSNTHDGSIEAVMTGAFAVGPLVAVVALVAGFVRAGSGRDG